MHFRFVFSGFILVGSLQKLEFAHLPENKNPWFLRTLKERSF